MRGSHEKPVDVPKSVLAAIDQIAAVRRIPTKRLVAEFLWEMVRKQSGKDDLPADLIERLKRLPNPYDPVNGDVHLYQRRVPSGG